MKKIAIGVVLVLIIISASLFNYTNKKETLIDPQEIVVIQGYNFSPENWLNIGVEVGVTQGHREDQLLLAFNESKVDDVKVLYENEIVYIYALENQDLERKDRLFHTEELLIPATDIKAAKVYIDDKRVLFVKFAYGVE